MCEFVFTVPFAYAVKAVNSSLSTPVGNRSERTGAPITDIARLPATTKYDDCHRACTMTICIVKATELEPVGAIRYRPEPPSENVTGLTPLADWKY